MNLLARIRSAFSGPRPEKAEAPSSVPPAGESRAFLAFADTGEVIRAEAVLRQAGLDVTVMAPPPSLRTGCDMVLVVPLMLAFHAATLLEEQSLPPLQMTPVAEGLLEPVSLFQTKDYGGWIMVRAANMKITAEKATGRIVNVSGGGCPDVPYLAARMLGRSVHEKDLAREHGRTLCGYALHLALQELQKYFSDHGGRDDA